MTRIIKKKLKYTRSIKKIYSTTFNFFSPSCTIIRSTLIGHLALLI